MKIGFDAKRAFHNQRGLGNYSRDLIRILQERTSDTLFLFNPKIKGSFKFTENTNTKIILPQSFFWKIFNSLWRLFGIEKQVKTHQLDLYHGLSGEIPLNIHKHTKTIVTIHDLIFIRYPKLYSFFDRKIHFYKFLYAAKKANHIIAISEQTKQDIIHFLGIDAEKISVVYQGCHNGFKKEYSFEQKQRIKEKYNLPNRFVLNVGAIEPRKNALEIVKAIKDLPISLVLVGAKTAYFQQIENFCKTHKMENRVISLHNVPMQDLPCIYQLSDVFCYPSIFEGFGIPIIEALFSKVPVITSKGSCFAEAGGQHSLYINIENAEKEIKNHIEFLLNNPDKSKDITQKGYEFVQKFTDNSVFDNLYKVYKQVVLK